MSEPSEEKPKIYINANYATPNFISFIIQFILFFALLISSIVFLFANLTQIVSDSSRFMFYFEMGISFMGVGLLLAIVPFLVFAVIFVQVKQQEEVEEFNKRAKKFFFDRSAISWVVFIPGIVLSILGMV